MRLLTISFFFTISLFIHGQTRAELEERRRQTLDEIAYVDKLLQATAKQRTQGVNDLKVIDNRIGLRENVIAGMRSEIELLNYRIELNTIAIDMMEEDLVRLRSEYAGNIKAAMNASKGYHPAIFILSARDFNQGYKRMKYIQQAAVYRRRQTEIISDIMIQIVESKNRLESDRQELNDLKGKEEAQKRQLETEQQRKRRLIQELSGKEKQLKQELENKRKIAARIQTEINKIIEEEKKKALASDMTPEQRLIGSDFATNRGRLPWPVERGIITARFGKQQHAVLKNVTEDNMGIQITSTGNTQVRSVFKGEVVRVFGISGGNMAVIIRHGKYLSVYQNIINVKVKPGDKVDTKQILGDLFLEADAGNKGMLNFMIFEETKKLNPELWITPKN
ncbi:MAG: peptidoglycan DD-metalloendopeptidase family protein [Bacteroidales bacterium]|nr:peptidoglycan DD-metalloendopeptidase family protein [Bacteroidales bacterium]